MHVYIFCSRSPSFLSGQLSWPLREKNSLSLQKRLSMSATRIKPTKVYVGVEYTCCADIDVTLANAIDSGFDFMCIPLVHPRQRRDAKGVSNRRLTPLTRSDRVMSSERWTTSVVGMISPWIDLDSSCEHSRRSSEQAFIEEMRWASHLSVPAVWLGTPKYRCDNFARTLLRCVLKDRMTAWISIPLIRNETMLREHLSPDMEDTLERRTEEDPWEAWNALRTACNYHPAIAVAIVLTENLPEDVDVVLRRWKGEPIKAIVLPTSIFMSNASGRPVLSAAHQRVVLALMEHGAQLVIRGKSRAAIGLQAYVDYVRYLNTEMRPKQTSQQEFESPYYDVLQMPLQPLMDNLESQTYETFEKDPVKYRQYEYAVRDALLKTPPSKVTTIMVVGAGRGPLVKASLRASVAAKRRVKIYAVEKNPSAVITLRNLHVDEHWGDRVTVIASDMRAWKTDLRADILVSELLGSLGDNELSPECLDGAQSFLNPESGISIPADSTSFLEPIMSSKLWNEAAKFKDLKHMETPYVVRMHNYARLSDHIATCFRFVHPNWSSPIDNERFARVRFKASFNAVLHGFAGYFHSTLYGEHAISIHPPTESKGMFSWFSIYFPLRDPVYVRSGETIEFCIWRCVSSKKVWYEWALASPRKSAIHNPNGRSYWIGL